MNVSTKIFNLKKKKPTSFANKFGGKDYMDSLLQNVGLNWQEN